MRREVTTRQYLRRLLSGCIRHAIVLICVVIASRSLEAQPIGPDIRLLDVAVNGVLEESIRIADAAVIDSSVVAVWGNRRVEEGVGVHPALMIATEQSPVRYLTDTDARPSGTVVVVPLGREGVVLWNDLRSPRRGIYSLRVNHRGEQTGPATLLIPDGYMTERPYVVTGESGATLLISQERGGKPEIDLVRLDVEGRIIEGPVMVRSGTIDRTESFPLRRGGFFVRVLDGEPILLQADGGLYPDDIPAGRFSHPFAFDGPTGFITTLAGGQFARFDSVHHQTPEWSVPGVGGTAIGRESLGWVVAGFTGDYYRWSYGYLFFLEETHIDETLHSIRDIKVDTVAGTYVPSSAFTSSLTAAGTSVTMLGDATSRGVDGNLQPDGAD